METITSQGHTPWLDTPPARPVATGHSPEEQARSFFAEGGDVVYTQPRPFVDRRRRWLLAGVGVVVVIAASVSAAVFRSAPGSARTHGSKSGAPATDTKKVRLLARSTVSVRVLDASEANGLAQPFAGQLRHLGFSVSATGEAPAVILSGNPSEIFYGPSGLTAAHTLAHSLTGSLGYVANPSLAGNNVTLWIASSQLAVRTAN
jgi:LytR cell envelope-related transcriptional attenuator